MNWRDIKWELTLIAVVVFILPPALWVYRDVTTARQLEAKLAALRAQGMPVTMAEAARGPGNFRVDHLLVADMVDPGARVLPRLPF